MIIVIHVANAFSLFVSSAGFSGGGESVSPSLKG